MQGTTLTWHQPPSCWAWARPGRSRSWRLAGARSRPPSSDSTGCRHRTQRAPPRQSKNLPGGGRDSCWNRFRNMLSLVPKNSTILLLLIERLWKRRAPCHRLIHQYFHFKTLSKQQKFHLQILCYSSRSKFREHDGIINIIKKIVLTARASWKKNR